MSPRPPKKRSNPLGRPKSSKSNPTFGKKLAVRSPATMMGTCPMPAARIHQPIIAPAEIPGLGLSGFTLKCRVQSAEWNCPFQGGSGTGRRRDSTSANSTSGSGGMQGVNQGIGSLAWHLEARLGKPVLDETALTNHYDFELKWDERPDEKPSADVIVQAVREQLGLELTATT